MRESDLQNLIRLHISDKRLGIIFRGNVGEAWTGERIEKLPDGSIRIYKPRRFRSGLPAGFPDLFGFAPVQVADRRLAVFTALEIKTPTGRVRPEQQHMIDFLISQGARAGIVRSIEDAEKIMLGL